MARFLVLQHYGGETLAAIVDAPRRSEIEWSNCSLGVGVWQTDTWRLPRERDAGGCSIASLARPRVLFLAASEFARTSLPPQAHKMGA